MKILYIHNEYAKFSGEEQAAKELAVLLEEHGHNVKWFIRKSSEIGNSLFEKTKAFVSGIYNPFAAKEVANLLDEYSPDLVQVQNLYPFLSSAIFKPIKLRNIPVVMRCPNYRLFCPEGLSLNPSGQICELCWGGHEENCVRLNCMGSPFKSIGYAARNAFGRISQNILNGVDMFIVQSEFQKLKFIYQGIPIEKIGILPGISPTLKFEIPRQLGKWVSFVGRVSAEKGIYEFIEAAAQAPDIPFKVAGNFDENYVAPDRMPHNIEFVGFKDGKELEEFYEQSRIIVVPSKWYEGFPNVIVKGMLHHKPIITTNIGAMQSIIDDRVNGLLIPPGDSIELSIAIRTLYYDIETCAKYGNNGFKKATSEYSRETIYRALMKIYSQAKSKK